MNEKYSNYLKIQCGMAKQDFIVPGELMTEIVNKLEEYKYIGDDEGEEYNNDEVIELCDKIEACVNE